MLLLLRLKNGKTSELDVDGILSIDGQPFVQSDPLADRIENLEIRVANLEAWASEPTPIPGNPAPVTDTPPLPNL